MKNRAACAREIIEWLDTKNETMSQREAEVEAILARYESVCEVCGNDPKLAEIAKRVGLRADIGAAEIRRLERENAALRQAPLLDETDVIIRDEDAASIAGSSAAPLCAPACGRLYNREWCAGGRVATPLTIAVHRIALYLY